MEREPGTNSQAIPQLRVKKWVRLTSDLGLEHENLLLCLYTLEGGDIVAGNVALLAGLEGASKPPITVTVVNDL